MTTEPLQPRDLTPHLVTRHFSPAWFAAVMGTGVVPLALSFSGADWLPWAARIFVPLAGLMFVLFLIPWTLKLVALRSDSARDFNHPVASAFLPTMPIALLVLSLDLLKFGHLFLAPDTARSIALVLTLLGSAGIYVLGISVIMHVFRHEGIRPEHANFGWFIPPVSKLLIPVVGFELAGHFPAQQDLLVGLSLASFGIGFFLFLFVGSAVYQRYLFVGLPQPKFAATFFVGIAPPAIIAVALFKFQHFAAGHDVLGQSCTALAPLINLAIMSHWGLAAWWFVMAVVMMVYYRRRRGLPFALSWWAFTFPTGALAIATGVAWQVTGFAFLRTAYDGVAFFLLVIWLVVFLRTVRGMITRQLFLPSH